MPSLTLLLKTCYPITHIMGEHGITDIDKLRHLLKHWVEHNEAHVKTYNEWADKSESMGKHDLALIIREIADKSEKLDELFKRAMEIVL